MKKCASFTNKSSVERIKMILSDDKRFIQSAYEMLHLYIE